MLLFEVVIASPSSRNSCFLVELIRVLWNQLLVLLQLVHAYRRQFLVQLELCLGQLGQVDYHQ